MYSQQYQKEPQKIIDILNEAVIKDPALQKPGMILQMSYGQGQYVVGDDLKVTPWTPTNNEARIVITDPKPNEFKDWSILVNSSLPSNILLKNRALGFTETQHPNGITFGNTIPDQRPLTQEELEHLIQASKAKPLQEKESITSIFDKMKWPGSKESKNANRTPAKKKRKKKSKNGRH